jgi:hypothetical protein
VVPFDEMPLGLSVLGWADIIGIGSLFGVAKSLAGRGP